MSRKSFDLMCIEIYQNGVRIAAIEAGNEPFQVCMVHQSKMNDMELSSKDMNDFEKDIERMDNLKRKLLV